MKDESKISELCSEIAQLTTNNNTPAVAVQELLEELVQEIKKEVQEEIGYVEGMGCVEGKWNFSDRITTLEALPSDQYLPWPPITGAWEDEITIDSDDEGDKSPNNRY